MTFERLRHTSPGATCPLKRLFAKFLAYPFSINQIQCLRCFKGVQDFLGRGGIPPATVKLGYQIPLPRDVVLAFRDMAFRLGEMP